MRVVAHQGLPPDLAPAIETSSFRAANCRRPPGPRAASTVALDDLDLRAWLPRKAAARTYATGSLVLAPFDAWSRHFGILVAIAFGTGRGFDDAQISLCTGIARQVALAMEATELYRAQAEEADVAGALARFGRDLIAHVHEPEFLDRLCESTAARSGLPGERDADEARRLTGIFTVIAGHGFSTTESSSRRCSRSRPSAWTDSSPGSLPTT